MKTHCYNYIVHSMLCCVKNQTQFKEKKNPTSPNHRQIQYLNVVQGDVNNVVSEEGSRRSDVNPSSDFVMNLSGAV